MGATEADVVDDELVVLDVVVDVVVLAVVEVELDELAPEVVLVLEAAELTVVGAIDVVVSGTVDDEGATVVAVVDESAGAGSVTAADFGDSDWALALDSPSAGVIPPIPAGRPSRFWPSIRSATLSSAPVVSSRPA